MSNPLLLICKPQVARSILVAGSIQGLPRPRALYRRVRLVAHAGDWCWSQLHGSTLIDPLPIPVSTEDPFASDRPLVRSDPTTLRLFVNRHHPFSEADWPAKIAALAASPLPSRARPRR
ncbi:MAG: hypothetical protein CV089_21820 [Nitrospira sp. WS110]|nr:hypothetical protein [Nitrospira sp. WS110]